MKEAKQKNRKAIKKEIKLSLIAKLKEVIATMAPGSQNLEKEIKKPLNKLAKKVSKELKSVQKTDAKTNQIQEVKTAPKSEKSKLEVKPKPGLSKSKPAKQLV